MICRYVFEFPKAFYHIWSVLLPSWLLPRVQHERDGEVMQVDVGVGRLLVTVIKCGF